MSSPADETRAEAERRLGRCREPIVPVPVPWTLSEPVVDVNVLDVEVNAEYIRDAVNLASKVAQQSPLGTEERDMAEYMLTIVQELYRQRGRVQFLEGWKLAVEAVFKTDE